MTEYPGLMRIKKELGLLQKLYGLYSSVMTVINGYFDILWTEVDIEKINSELSDMQNKYYVSYVLQICYHELHYHALLILVLWYELNYFPSISKLDV